MPYKDRQVRREKDRERKRKLRLARRKEKEMRILQEKIRALQIRILNEPISRASELGA